MSQREEILKYCLEGNEADLQRLISKGLDFFTEFDGADAFDLPLSNAKNAQIAELLYENDADVPSATDVPLLNAIIENVAENKIELSTLAFVASRSPNIDGEWDGMTGDLAIHAAVRTGRFDIVRALVDAGVRLDIASNDGDTAIGIAAEQGNEEIVSLLLLNHAPLSAREYSFVIEFEDKSEKPKVIAPSKLAKTKSIKALLKPK